MFAVALWDRQRRVLSLARDRLGEKPLYFGWAGDTFVFGSELAALRAHPHARFVVDRLSLTSYFRYGYVPAPHSIYEDVGKVLPGSILEVRPDALREPATTTYWSALDVADAGMRTPFTGSSREAVDALEEVLEDSVALRMVADVPVGAFLSGGVDSSLVVALMQRQTSRPVRTFSIGFDEPQWNEADRAAEVARRLGTEHAELYVTVDDALAVIPALGAIYDEPLGDPSQLPTVFVSRLARHSVSVTLTGDGGDELFGGYDRYAVATDLWRHVQQVPRGARQWAAATVERLPAASVDRFAEAVTAMLPRRMQGTRPGPRLRKLAMMLAADSPADAYHRLSSHRWSSTDLVRGGEERLSPFSDPAHRLASTDAVAAAMYLDTVTYLRDDILTKVDRATMSVGLEGRMPLLDHRVYELAWRFPGELKRRDGTGKWILREVLGRHLPAGLFERPKMGLGVPIANWLRGPLRGWAEDLLRTARLRDDGYLEPDAVATMWRAHLSGRSDLSVPLWDVLMFQSWYENQRSG
jgi:asparagine synthase (glutamine-hydrolysing)